MIGKTTQTQPGRIRPLNGSVIKAPGKNRATVWLMLTKGLALLLAMAAIFPVSAVKAEPEGNRTLAPYFIVDGEESAVERFPLETTDVRVNISGVIAEVILRQRYTNNGSVPINSRYIFPASTNAAVHRMTMTIGEEKIQARVKEKQAARKTYETAKKEGKSASLLEQRRPNVFSMRVANVMPGESIDIELSYTELLTPVDGVYSFVFPTVVGPRYSSQLEAAADERDRWIANPYLKADQPPKSRFFIEAEISSPLPISDAECSSHDAVVYWEGENKAHIGLKPGDDFSGNRDFILNYRLAGKRIDSGLMLSKGEGENFFLLMVQPPERVIPEEIPPREYIFIVDVSGSMHGFPLNTSKTLLRDLIGNLRPEDRFNVVLFAGTSRILAPESLAATSENAARAVSLIDNERGGGGTELLSAVKQAMTLPGREGVARSLIVVTDGYIAAEREVFSWISGHLDKSNVFAFGIGSSVNRYLIEGVAKAGGGEPFVVTEPAKAPAAAHRFRQYVQSPVLVDIAVDWEGFDVYDVEPPAVSDLFAGRPVVVFGKWRGKPEGRVRVSGISGKGRYEKTLNVADAGPAEDKSPLAYLWARTRIARLSDFNPSGAGDEEKRQITSLGLTYNLLTAYTSFVAVHEKVRNPSGQSKNITQPLPLPAHVSALAVGGGVRRVPEPGLALIALFLAVAFIFSRLARKGRNRSFVEGSASMTDDAPELVNQIRPKGRKPV